MLNDQDVRLFFAKQMTEREARRKMEKENQSIKAEEYKVRSKLQELEDFLIRNESERAEKDMVQQERMEHTQHELHAVSSTLSEQIDALSAEKDVLLEDIRIAALRASAAEEKMALMETAMRSASHEHEQARIALEAQVDAMCTQLRNTEACLEAKETEYAGHAASAQDCLVVLQEEVRCKGAELDEQRAALYSTQCTVESAKTAQYLAEDHSRLITMEVP